jgi:hypothetical protein
MPSKYRPKRPMRVARLATPRPEFLSPMLWKRENPSHLQPDHLRVGRSFVCRVVLADHLAARVCARRRLELVIASSPARGGDRTTRAIMQQAGNGNRCRRSGATSHFVEGARAATSRSVQGALRDPTSAIGESGGADLGPDDQAFGLAGYADNPRTDMPKLGPCPLLQIQRPLYPSIAVLNASRFPLPGNSCQSRSCSQ